MFHFTNSQATSPPVLHADLQQAVNGDRARQGKREAIIVLYWTPLALAVKH